MAFMVYRVYIFTLLFFNLCSASSDFSHNISFLIVFNFLYACFFFCRQLVFDSTMMKSVVNEVIE